MDNRKFLETISDVKGYGIKEINDLVNFYGGNKKGGNIYIIYKGESVFQKADLDKNATLAEFDSFNQIMFEKRNTEK